MDWGSNSDHHIEDDTPNHDIEKFYKMIEEVLWMPTKNQRMVMLQGWICKLERVFTTAFFNFMVHLMVNLPKQVMIAGRVQYRWMYPSQM